MEPLVGKCTFLFMCPREWDQLKKTEEHAVRFCDMCEAPVYLRETDAELRVHIVADHCVAIGFRRGEQRPFARATSAVDRMTGDMREESGLRPGSITVGVPKRDWSGIQMSDRLLNDWWATPRDS